MTTTYYPTRDGAVLIPAGDPRLSDERLVDDMSRRLPAGWHGVTGGRRVNCGRSSGRPTVTCATSRARGSPPPSPPVTR